MANQTEIAAMIDEKLKEHVNAMNEQIAAVMSKMMNDLKAKQQQINASSQSEIPPPTRQGLRPDKTPAVNADPTFQLDDVILTGTSVSPAAHVLHSPPNDENAKLLAKLDQRLREVEGTQSVPPVDLSVFARVQVPDKFKMPAFEKYDGTSNPIQHIEMYQGLMNRYVSNGPLMIQTFQASLKDAAMRWYTNHQINCKDSWEEVANLFVKHFKFNLNVTITREDQERVEQKKGETLKEYATRWRNMAGQIMLEPLERDLMKLFVSTLPQPVRSRMLVTAVQSFSQLIAIGEEIESGLKKGWYGESGSSSRRFASKKDKEHVPEVNMTYV